MKGLRFPRVNTVVLSGRLTREPELRYATNGTEVAKLPLAFDRAYKKNGEWVQDVSYLDVIVWGERGKQCAEQLGKGDPILLEGYINTRSYTDKQNNNRKMVEIVAHKVSFLEKDLDYDHQTGEIYDDDSNTGYDGGGQSDDDDVPF